MEQMLSLLLDLKEQSQWGYCFQLRIENKSFQPLFIPTLTITHLHFAPVESPEPLEWCTHWMVSAESGGTTIESSSQQTFMLRARPCTIHEETASFEGDWEYSRWCVKLVQGEYRVWYDLSVDATYINPDSHLRYADIKKMADKAGASLWCGSVRSNVINVYHSEQRD